MNIWQIIIYVLLALFLLNYIRKLIAAGKISNYSVDEAKKKSRELNAVFLDVRTVAERQNGHIKNSIHIPLNRLNSKADELNKFKDKEIICYCRSGNRSMTAAIMLKKKGFNAANLKNGYIAWS